MDSIKLSRRRQGNETLSQLREERAGGEGPDSLPDAMRMITASILA